MPDQIIDFSTLNTVEFNGTDLTEVIIDGSTVWTLLPETWVQIGTDITNPGTGLDEVGSIVSLNDVGDIVAFTAPYNIDGGANSGEIRVFERIGDSWSQVGSDIEGITGERATSTGLGPHCVSLNGVGDVVATSWPGNDEVGTDSGQVRVYKNVSNTWTLTGGDINTTAGDTRYGSYNGLSLNREGNIVAIGGWLGGDQTGVSDPGIVDVYEMVAGTWTQLGQTLSGETTGVPGNYNENADYFGYSVSLNSDGDILLVGGWANDNNDYPNLPAAGHARVFEYTTGTWTQIGSDIDGGSAGLLFGYNTSINNAGNIVAIGGYGDGAVVGTETGVVRIFENVTGTWTQIGSDIVGVDSDDRTGYSLELNGAGDIITVGDVIHDSSNVTNIGRVRVFKNVEGEWVQHGAAILGSEENEYTGHSVALNRVGNITAVGSPGALSGRGKVEVFADDAVKLQSGSQLMSVSFDADGSRVVSSNPTALSDAGEVSVSEWTGSNWSQVGQTVVGNTDAENSSGYVGDADRLKSGGLNSDGSLVLTLAPGDSSTFNKGRAQVYQYNQSNSTWETYGQELSGVNNGDNLGKTGFISANGEDILIYTGDTNGSLQRYHYNLNQWDTNNLTPIGGISLSNKTVLATPDLEYIVHTASAFSTYNFATIYKWASSGGGGQYNQHGTTFNGSVGDNLFCPAISPNGQRVVIVIDAGVNNPGVVKVYEWSGTAWIQIGQTMTGSSGSRLGASAAINENLLILGEPSFNFQGESVDRGRFSVYQYDSTLDEFVLLQTVINPNSISDVNNQYGKTLHLSPDGSTLLLSNVGDIYNIDY